MKLSKTALGVIFLFFLGVLLALRFIPVAAPDISRDKNLLICEEEVTEGSPAVAGKKLFCRDLQKLQAVYASQIAPILKEKCLACHGSPPTLPLYAKVSGIREVIHQDRLDAKEAMDFSLGFPFQSKWSVTEDLKRLKDVVRQKDMPPLRFLLTHWFSSLSETDRQKMFSWIEQAEKSQEKPQ